MKIFGLLLVVVVACAGFSPTTVPSASGIRRATSDVWSPYYGTPGSRKYSTKVNDMSSGHCFNAGKMEHIYLFSEGSYIPEFTSVEAKEALEQSQHYYFKLDGACAMLVYDRGTDRLEIYERFDTRGKEPSADLTALPLQSRNPVTYQGHTYFMKKVVANPKTDGKKLLKTKEALLDILDRHKESLRDLILSSTSADNVEAGRRSLSVELVGAKYQRTPGVNVPVAIAPHCEQRLPSTMQLPRDFEQAKELLLGDEYVVEGLVLSHKNKYWKLRSRMFDRDCLFETAKAKAMPPVKVYK